MGRPWSTRIEEGNAGRAVAKALFSFGDSLYLSSRPRALVSIQPFVSSHIPAGSATPQQSMLSPPHACVQTAPRFFPSIPAVGSLPFSLHSGIGDNDASSLRVIRATVCSPSLPGDNGFDNEDQMARRLESRCQRVSSFHAHRRDSCSCRSKNDSRL